MARRKRHRRGGRTTPKGTRPRGFHHYQDPGPAPVFDGAGPGFDPPTSDEPDLLADTRRSIDSGEPLDLLSDVSTLLTVCDPRQKDPFTQASDEPSTIPTVAEMVESFIGIPRSETTALLAVIAELVDNDELVVTRVKRELAQRHDRLPAWLDAIADCEVYQTIEITHIQGDGDNVMLGVRFPTGDELTLAVYIDHNMGTLVKDAFVLPESIAEVSQLMRSEAGPHTAINDLDPAVARARTVDAIEVAAMTVPRFETETWPACRPLVEWAIRKLPEGGTGYVRPEWTEQGERELADRFFDSSYGHPLDDDLHRSLLDSILWFGTGYGPGDPLRWSPVAVELILDDWIPRKIVADEEYLSHAPALLRAFIRFSADERDFPPELTLDTLAAVDAHEPAYQQAIGSHRPQGPESLLASVEALGLEGLDGIKDIDGIEDADGLGELVDMFNDMFFNTVPFEDPDYVQSMVESLEAAVGGEKALATLDTGPLPDEAFAWTDIADDIAGKVREVLDLCDLCCDELLSPVIDDAVEVRTACRRLLALVAGRAPKVFRGAGRSDTAAAAIVWLIGGANDIFSAQSDGVMVKDLTAYFELKSSPSPRAARMAKAAGLRVAMDGYYVIGALGRSDLLTAGRRQAFVAERNGWTAD